MRFKWANVYCSILYISVDREKCLYFITLVFFFTKQLLLVQLDTPRKDFKFLQIIKGFFLFISNSPVYFTIGESRLPGVFTVGKST
jgi:hypothetical protein